MRKICLKIKSNDLVKKILSPFFNNILSFEIIDMLRQDFHTLQEAGIVKIVLKSGSNIEDLDLPMEVLNLDVLYSNGDEYFCFMKVKHNESFKDLFSLFNLDLIWDRPTIFRLDELVISCSSTEENLKKFIDMAKNFGDVVNISYSYLDYKDNNFLSCLTKKQKQVFTLAYESGYFDIPKRISSVDLALKLNCSKSAVIEHLRKCENRIFNYLMNFKK